VSVEPAAQLAYRAGLSGLHGSAMADLATAITEIRRDGRQRSVRCPAHHDTRASLSVGIGTDGRVLVHCHAGCATREIVVAAGLAMADLAPKATGGGPSSQGIVASYDYTDESGALLFQLVRFHPKDFRQRRPDGAGGWIWNTTGIRRVLFGLQELVNATTVYIAEGEKDVLSLRSLGLTATTNSGGAAKWRDDYASQLRVAGVEAVIVLPDNDEAGRKHAIRVAQSCRAAGLIVTVVKLPDLAEHGDVTDWISAGHTADDLDLLVEQAAIQDDSSPPNRLPSDDRMARTDPLAAEDAPEPEGERILDPDAPLATARAFARRHHTVDGILTLRHQAGVFYRYDRQWNSYAEKEDAIIRAALYRFLDKAERRDKERLVPFNPTKAKVENVLDALRALANPPACPGRSQDTNAATPHTGPSA